MKASKKIAIVLLSGGLDSSVSLWWAKNKLYSQIHCLTFEYGSKEEIVLHRVARKLATLCSIDHHEFIPLDFLADFSRRVGSSLTQESTISLPTLSLKDLDDSSITSQSAKSVWIPARNLVFLAIASSYAETLASSIDIITGFNNEEGRTFPDNTQQFMNDFTRTASRGVLKAKIKVLSPLARLNKEKILLLGKKLAVPFEYTNSCYNPKGFNESGKPIHCGKCESCLRRKRGFITSELEDLTVYY